ncbi:hypothetical protein STRDD11_00460 [Streptococcus sp. DD11]|nr:hypothetical protein STRDD11_00460 [Streptococcus sp. DD11]
MFRENKRFAAIKPFSKKKNQIKNLSNLEKKLFFSYNEV